MSSTLRFRILMAFALTSTTFETARFTVMVWALGNPENSPYVLLVSQLLIVLGGLLGASTAPRLARRMGNSRTVLVAFCSLTAYATAVAAVDHIVGDVDARSASWVIACLGGIFGFVATFNGTVWLPLLNDWDCASTDSSRARLQVDSAIYQTGKVLGPLASGVLFVLLPRPLLIVSALDAASYLALGIFASKCVTAGYGPPYGEATTPSRKQGGIAKSRLAQLCTNSQFRIGVSLLLVTMAIDGVKLYLPLLIQTAGASGSVYGIVQACLAASGIVAALAFSQFNVRTFTMVVLGCGLLSLGLAGWALAFSYPLFWIIGAIAIGSGGAAVFPSVTSSLLSAARDSASRSTAAGAIVLTRQWGGALGGAATVGLLSVAPVASIVLMVAAVAVAASWLTIPRTIPRTVSFDEFRRY